MFKDDVLNALNKYLTNVHPRRYETLDEVPEGVKVVKLQDRYYPESRVLKIGEQLSQPRFMHNTYAYDDIDTEYMPTFVETPNLKGWIKAGSDSSKGEVLFATRIKERDILDDDGFFSTSSPTELNTDVEGDSQYYTEAGIADLKKMKTAFESLMNSSRGKGLYYNSPVGGMGGKRASIYNRMGFINGDYQQLLDNRRFKNSPMANDAKLYFDNLSSSENPALLHPNATQRYADMVVLRQLPIRGAEVESRVVRRVPQTDDGWSIFDDMFNDTIEPF